jgi:hypothetical protein
LGGRSGESKDLGKKERAESYLDEKELSPRAHELLMILS